MAGICSLGFICGLALAPRAKKQTRFHLKIVRFEGFLFINTVYPLFFQQKNRRWKFTGWDAGGAV